MARLPGQGLGGRRAEGERGILDQKYTFGEQRSELLCRATKRAKHSTWAATAREVEGLFDDAGEVVDVHDKVVVFGDLARHLQHGEMDASFGLPTRATLKGSQSWAVQRGGSAGSSRVMASHIAMSARQFPHIGPSCNELWGPRPSIAGPSALPSCVLANSEISRVLCAVALRQPAGRCWAADREWHPFGSVQQDSGDPVNQSRSVLLALAALLSAPYAWTSCWLSCTYFCSISSQRGGNLIFAVYRTAGPWSWPHLPY